MFGRIFNKLGAVSVYCGLDKMVYMSASGRKQAAKIHGRLSLTHVPDRILVFDASGCRVISWKAREHALETGQSDVKS